MTARVWFKQVKLRLGPVTADTSLGIFFLHTPLPPHLQRPHMKIHQAFAKGLLVLDPASAEKFKGTQAPTKNNLR